MEHNRKAAAANAHAAAASAEQAATSARLAEIDAKFARSGDLACFLREVGAAGFTLADLADWLSTSSAAGIPKFAVGGIYPGDFLVSKDVAAAHLATIQPAAFNPWSEVLAMGREITRLNTQIARLLDRWDGDGMPAVRGH